MKIRTSASFRRGITLSLVLSLLGLNAADAASWWSRRGDNTAPEISGTPPSSVTAGQSYAFRPVVRDAEGDRLWYQIRNQPSWTRFDPRTGQLSGVPTSAHVGSYGDIAIFVSDLLSYDALPKFAIRVEDAADQGNQPPSINGAPATSVVAGVTYAFQPSAADPDGDRLSFAIENRPAWANFDPATGRLSGPTTTANIGSYGNIVVSVTDGTTFSAVPPFKVEVTAAPNRAPTITGAPATSVVADKAYAFTPTASDPDGDKLTFRIAGKPVWASFDAGTGRLSGSPGSANVGVYANIVIGVADNQASSELAPFSIAVTATPNRAPTISGTPSTTVSAGQAYSFVPSGIDPDGDVMMFSIQNRPVWATFSTSTGRLSGTPTSTQVGAYAGVVISVTDGKDSSSLAPFGIEVKTAPNRAPTIAGAPTTTVIAGQAYSFAPSATDPDGDKLTFSVSGKPAWASFDSATGRLSGTPGATDVGFYYNIVVGVTDGAATASLPAFTVKVEQPATGSVTLSWQAPTLNEDGTPLTNLTGYQVAYGQASGQYSQNLSLPNGGFNSVTIEDLAPATWYFSVRAVNAAGALSDFSNEANKTIH